MFVSNARYTFSIALFIFFPLTVILYMIITGKRRYTSNASVRGYHTNIPPLPNRWLYVAVVDYLELESTEFAQCEWIVNPISVCSLRNFVGSGQSRTATKNCTIYSSSSSHCSSAKRSVMNRFQPQRFNLTSIFNAELSKIKSFHGLRSLVDKQS